MGHIQPKQEGGVVLQRSWEPAPIFDKEGRPIEHLKTCVGKSDVKPTDSAKVAYAKRRDALARAISEAGLKRPALRKGLIAKKKKTRSAVKGKE